MLANFHLGKWFLGEWVRLFIPLKKINKFMVFFNMRHVFCQELYSVTLLNTSPYRRPIEPTGEKNSWIYYAC